MEMVFCLAAEVVVGAVAGVKTAEVADVVRTGEVVAAAGRTAVEIPNQHPWNPIH